MNIHKIDKILVLKTEAKSGYMYQFDVLSVNDRFWVPKEKKVSIRSAVQYFQNRDGTKFSTRLVGNKIVVWRTS